MHRIVVFILFGMAASIALAGGLDTDNDGVPDDVDCRPDDGSLWSPPGEPVTDLTLSRVGSVALLDWSTPSDTGGDPGTERYDTFGTLAPDAFGYATGFCVELDNGNLTATHDRAPRPGETVYYLVRIENDCGTGPVDTDPPPVEPRSLNYLVADNTNDSGPGSLREAIDLAQDGDAICMEASGTLVLASDLEILKDIAIVGPGADLLTIEPGGIHVLGGASLSDMGVTGGGSGWGVFLEGRSTIASMALTDLSRGVLVGNGSYSIVDCTITDNSIGVFGTCGNGGLVAITTTTLSGNSSSGVALCDYWDATITSSTVSDNGTGIDLWGPENIVAITTSTISGNGTGISVTYSYPDNLSITSSTITGNTTGIEFYDAHTNLQNTVLSNTTNCLATGSIDLHSGGHNLSSDMTCPDLTAEGDQVNVDPLLGPLADNGGPTETHAPLPGSPVIDAGNCPGQTLDQRGLPRPIDDPTRPDVADGCDIGAVEKQ